MDETRSDSTEEREWEKLPYIASDKSFLKVLLSCMRHRVDRGIYDDKDKKELIDRFVEIHNFSFFVMFATISLACIITDRDEYIKFIKVIDASNGIPAPWRGEMLFVRDEMVAALNMLDFEAIEHVDDIDYFYEQLHVRAKTRISLKGRRREIIAKIGRKPRATINALDTYYLRRLQNESSEAGDKIESKNE